ncbi:hypothetical protein [Ligilactobacillus ubinensis]|nr:hypothetical protein [Ligilactobacillus ubinensis]
MNCSVIEEVHAIPFVLRPLIDDFFQVKEARELNRLLNESIKKT